MAEVTPSNEDRDVRDDRLVREAREARAAHEAAGDPDAGPAAAPIHRTEAPASTSTPGTGTAAGTGRTPTGSAASGSEAGVGAAGTGSAHGPVSGSSLIGGRAGSATDDALTGGTGVHHETHTTHQTHETHQTHGHGGEPHAAHPPLLAHGDTEKFSAQLHHAVGGFVDAPRAAVEEADHVLEEVADLFADALNRRRRDLRAAWQAGDGDDGDTERLRVALRDYREFAERLLHV